MPETIKRINPDPEVLLVKPVVKHPIVREDCDIPLGIVSIISFIRDKFPDLRISLHDERLQKLKDGQEPNLDYLNNVDVIGVTACSNEIPRGLKILKEAHEQDRVTVFGGVFPSGNATYLVENYQYIDYVVAGEGEIAFTKLIEALKRGDEEALRSIKGLVYKRNGQIINNGSADRLEQIPSSIGVYEQKIIDPEEYFRYVQIETHRGRVIPTMATRGCPGKCAMCSLSSVWEGKHTARSLDEIVDEIAFMQKIQGVDGINFKDDELFTPRYFAEQLFKAILDAKKGGKINSRMRFKCKSRVKSMDEPMLDLLAEAGVYCIQYGVETTNEAILQSMKGVSLEQVKRVLKATQERGITINPTFIFGGLEGQTYDDLLKTTDFISSFGRYPEIKPYFTFCTPHPKNGGFTASEGHLMVSEDLDDFNHKRPIVEHPSLPLEKVIEAHTAVVQATGTEKLNPFIETEHIAKLSSSERIGGLQVPIYDV